MTEYLDSAITWLALMVLVVIIMGIDATVRKLWK